MLSSRRLDFDIHSKMMSNCLLMTMILGITLIYCDENVFDSFVNIINGESSICESKDLNWKCCATAPPVFNYSITVCTNLQYLRQNIGVNMSVSINDRITLHEEISLKNPPPICSGVPIPYLDKVVEVCLRFYNLDIRNLPSVRGCLKFEGRLVTAIVMKMKIGCFKFPNSTNQKDPGNDETGLPPTTMIDI